MIHHEADEMQQERGGVRDPSAGDLSEQGMPSILTPNGTVVRVGNPAPQPTAASVQSAIVSPVFPCLTTCLPFHPHFITFLVLIIILLSF